MALVSPGISISINDQSQYVNSNVGSVPLVVLATAQDKTYNGSLAAGTSKANAGVLQSFTSQRDLVTQLGTPSFQLSSSGTPINGGELSEYGLLTAYSALGLGNRLFAIRADVNLNELIGTSVRPAGMADDGTYWLDLGNTNFGISVLNSVTNTFSTVSPLLITDGVNQTELVNLASSGTLYGSAPKSTVGQPGSYALVFVNPDDTPTTTVRLFYKATNESTAGGTSGASNPLTNNWIQVGSTDWQRSNPAIIGTIANPTLLGSSTLTINGTSYTTGSGDTTVLALANFINSKNIPGVTATATNGLLTFFVTSASKSNGSTTDGKLALVDGTHTPFALCGVTVTSAWSPILFYGTYAQQPSQGWFGSSYGDTAARPTGSIWWKTTSTGNGYSPVLKKFSSSLDEWVPEAAPMFTTLSDANYALDPIGGGINIAPGQVISKIGVTDGTWNTLTYAVRGSATQTVATGTTPSAFTVGDAFNIYTSIPGSSGQQGPFSITLSSTTAADYVSAILGANIPYITAQLNTNGTISVIHTAGGEISILNTTGTPNADAGFLDGQGSGFTVNLSTGGISASNWKFITNISSLTTPNGKPATGTLWYYSNPADIDIMINTGIGWKGYCTVTADVRGYDLTATDTNGVIVSSTQPTTKSDGSSALTAGDLWLDSSDLVNYPNLSRYTGSAWVAIDNTDHVSNNGIIFADARWDTTGTTDVVSGEYPSIASLAVSNYLDLDAPDYRLYPKGTLLFNTRRSGFNVKKYVKNYFNSVSFPNDSLPTVADAWVTDSGLNESGVMNAGSAAQRAIIVAAMKSAIDSNTDVIEDNYNFNLLVAPGYPELIPNLVTLNDNRGSTGFVIGDTPLTLAPTATALTQWNNNTGAYAGKGLATASPYLGVYYPAGLTNDLAGNTVAVPASHAVLRTFLYNDNVSYPWFAPAGVHRGLVDNLSDIGYVNTATGAFVHTGINQGMRDTLATLSINPITQLPGVGLVVWGQETRSGSSTSRNRVNVVRLENYVRTIFKTIANGFLFEPNDTITRKSLATQIESSLHDLLSKRGLYDFLVICDTSNNTSSTIANNQLYVDVAIEPMKDVEFIYIPVALYNPGTIATLGARST